MFFSAPDRGTPKKNANGMPPGDAGSTVCLKPGGLALMATKYRIHGTGIGLLRSS